MNRRIFRPVLTRKRGLVSVLAAALAAGLSLGIAGCGGRRRRRPGRPCADPGRGQRAGAAQRPASPNKLTRESAMQVDLSTESVRLVLDSRPSTPTSRSSTSACMWASR